MPINYTFDPCYTCYMGSYQTIKEIKQLFELSLEYYFWALNPNLNKKFSLMKI